MFTEPSQAVGIHLGWELCEIALADPTHSFFRVADTGTGLPFLPDPREPASAGPALDLVPRLVDLLETLRNNLSQIMQQKVRLDNAVCAVPFSHQEMLAPLLEKAGKSAGFHSMKVISEPEALGQFCFRLFPQRQLVLARVTTTSLLAGVVEKSDFGVDVTVVQTMDHLPRISDKIEEIAGIVRDRPRDLSSSAPLVVIAENTEDEWLSVFRDGSSPPFFLPARHARCVFGSAWLAAHHPQRYYLCSHRNKPTEESIIHGVLEFQTTFPVSGKSCSIAGTFQPGDSSDSEGVSLQVQTFPRGEVQEIFCNSEGGFEIPLAESAAKGTWLTLAICNPEGNQLASFPTCFPAKSNPSIPTETDLSGRFLTGTVSAGFLNHKGERYKKPLFGPGTLLPCSVRYWARTTDQSGLVVPLYLNQEKIIDLTFPDLATDIRRRSLVEIHFSLTESRHLTTDLSICHSGRSSRINTTLPAEAAPPSPEDFRGLQHRLAALLENLTGHFRTRLETQSLQLREKFDQAVQHKDQAAVRNLFHELELLLAGVQKSLQDELKPPLKEFSQLVRNCLIAAGEVSSQTGRNPDELFEQVYVQERYGEGAYQERDVQTYQECFQNLLKYQRYLESLKRQSPGFHEPGHPLPTEQDVYLAVRRLQDKVQSLLEHPAVLARGDLHAALSRFPDRLKFVLEIVRHDLPQAVHHMDQNYEEFQELLKRLPEGVGDSRQGTQGMLEGFFSDW